VEFSPPGSLSPLVCFLFQLALVVSDKGGISAREFLSPMRSAQTPTHLFRLARSS
jgi:hypothetical protein